MRYEGTTIKEDSFSWQYMMQSAGAHMKASDKDYIN